MLTSAQQTKRSPETGDLLVPVQCSGASQPLYCNCGAWLSDRAFSEKTRIEDEAAALVIQRWTTFSFMRADRCLQPCIESARMRKATFICSS